MDPTSAIIGFLLGVVGSLLASMAFEQWTRPRITIRVEQTRARGEPLALEYFHVVVKNERDTSIEESGPGLRPAWSCSATIEVIDPDATLPTIGPIAARWSSLPEPLTTVVVGDNTVRVVDAGRMILGPTVDIHSHAPQPIPVILKYEGDDNCYLFNNLSYDPKYPRGCNPTWQLGLGRHLLRISVYGEFGRRQEDFWLDNSGPRRDDVRLEARVI
jgi:hypothetical protein